MKNSSIVIPSFAIGIFLGFLLGRMDFKKLMITQKKQSQVSVEPATDTNKRSATSIEPVKPAIGAFKDGTLPPPELTPDMPKIFDTKQTGEFRLTWRPVPGASRYRVKILDTKNNVVMTRSTPSNVLYVQQIPWNGSDSPQVTYKAFMVSVNNAGAEGPEGETRLIKLYKDRAHLTPDRVDKNPLAAPEIKSISTED